MYIAIYSVILSIFSLSLVGYAIGTLTICWRTMLNTFIASVFFCLATLLTSPVLAAGGVVGESGSCVINIGFYTAHFTIYQPENTTNEEFCEDLPDVGKTVFVLDYLHATLQEVPVDFRIIRDIQSFGRFAKVENIMEIEDLSTQTVFYAPAIIHKDERMMVEFDFTKTGDYIGIVSAGHPSKAIIYHSVFPFTVGNGNFTWWPLILLLLVIFQVRYMVSHGVADRLLQLMRGN
jgi:hypothetical protein